MTIHERRRAGGAMTAFRPLPVLSAFSAAALAVLIALGVWQLHRLAWKTELLGQLAARGAEAPISLDVALTRLRAGEDLRFQPIALTGAYAHEAEARMPTAVSGGAGWRLVTPLQVDEARWIVFIDRGLAPARAVETGADLARPDGGVQVVGLIRPPSRSNAFTPPADPATRTIYAFGQAVSLGVLGGDPDAVAPFVVAATLESPEAGARWPASAPPSVDDISNRHLEYALTWFGLAAALIAVYIAFHASKGRFGPPR